MVMVARLDGTSSGVINERVDDAIEAERVGLWGRAYIDLARKTDGGFAQGESWLVNTAKLYGQAGFLTVIDAHGPTYPPNYPMEDAALYFGLMSALAEEYGDIHRIMDFDHAKENFVSAARRGPLLRHPPG